MYLKLNYFSMMNCFYHGNFKGISINIDGNDHLGVLSENNFV